jgi:hypothetical protein
MWRQKVLSILVLLATTAATDSVLHAQEMMELPVEVRKWFRNPDGSCVQCSIGMCGTWNNVPAATTLSAGRENLWSADICLPTLLDGVRCHC